MTGGAEHVGVEDEQPRARPRSRGRLLSWLGGSFLLYVLGEPFQEQVIDPLLEPVVTGGNEAVGLLFRPLAVLLVPLVVCAGVVVLAARASADPEGWPRPLRAVAAALVVLFLGAALWSSLAENPSLTYLATAALSLIAILGLTRTSSIGAGRKVGAAAMVLALAALLSGISMAKRAVGVLDPISAAARIELGGSLLLGLCLCAFGLAVLLDLRRLLMVVMAAAVVPSAVWSVIAFAVNGFPLFGTGYGLVAAALATGAAALHRGGPHAPGMAGVIGGIAGKRGTAAAVTAGCAAVAIGAAIYFDLDRGIVVGEQGLAVTAYAVGGLAFWACAVALITGHRLPMATASLLLGVAFGSAAAAETLLGAYGHEDGTTTALYIDWTLTASSDALASAAFLIAGGSLLVRLYDKQGRIKHLVTDLVGRLRRP